MGIVPSTLIGYGETFNQALTCLVDSLFYEGLEVVNSEMVEVPLNSGGSDYFLDIRNRGWVKITSSRINGIWKLQLSEATSPYQSERKRIHIAKRGIHIRK